MVYSLSLGLLLLLCKTISAIIISNSSCEVGNETISTVAEALRFYHCRMGELYLNDIRYQVLSEIFDRLSPPTNVSISEDLIKALTEVYNKSSSINFDNEGMQVTMTL